MRKALLSIAFLALMPLANAQFKYAENQDYFQLPQVEQSIEAPIVQEFFWFGCPHCNDVYPALQNWIKQGKPEAVKVEKIPAIPSDRWLVAGQLYYTAQALKLDIDAKVYDAVHKERKQEIIFDVKKAKAFLVSQGADKEAVEKAWGSFAVKQSLHRARELFNGLGLEGVPSFVVNGNYLVPVNPDYTRLFDVIETVAMTVKK